MSSTGHGDDEKFRIRMAEAMASGGVGYNRISQEVLYLLPDSFITQYEALYREALVDPTKSSGDALAAAGELGKAKTHTEFKGDSRGRGVGQGGGAGKKYKKFFTVKDEDMLALKDLIDKRLRAMAREIRYGIAIRAEDQAQARAGARTNTRTHTERSRLTVQCKTCGKLTRSGWTFCPDDGTELVVVRSG